MIKKFTFLFVLIGIFFFTLCVKDTNAIHGNTSAISVGFFHNNGSTNWEVAYRMYWANGARPPVPRSGVTGVYFMWTNVTRNAFATGLNRTFDWGHLDLTRFRWGPSSGRHPPFHIQWGTTCIDPVQPATWTGENVGGNQPGDSVWTYHFRVNVTSGRSGADNSGANIGYAYGNAIVGRTDACPFPCGEPSCSGRCGTIRNNCGYGISNSRTCGGCGSNFCGSGGNRCDWMNPTCNNNGFCVNVNTGRNPSQCNGRNNCCQNDTHCNSNQYCHNPPDGECRNELRISGNVYLDRNRNGSWDGEPQDLGLSGRTVQRRNASASTWTNTDTTGGNGGYAFTGLRNPSSHDIRIVLSEYDTACRYNFPGNNPRNNVDATNNNVDFRFVERLYNITGYVYDDANGNNVLDASDPPFINRPNVQINVMNEGRNDTLNPANARFQITGNSEGNYTLRLVTSTLPGNYRVVGSAQRDVTVNCADTHQNNFLVTNAPRPTGIDLDVTSFSFPDGTVSSPANASVTVQNSGTVGTGAGFNVRVRNSPTGASVTQPTAALAAGEIRTINVTVPRPATAGVYTADVLVDSGNAIAETDEGNNTSTDLYNATSGGGGGPEPNLTITAFTVPDAPADSPVTSSVTILNDGGITTGAGFSVSLDVGYGTTAPITVPTAALAAGATRTINIPFTTPNLSVAQPLTAEVTVDSTGAIVESDEDDNSANDIYNVGAANPTYTITGGVYEDDPPLNFVRDAASEPYIAADLRLDVPSGSPITNPPPSLGSSWPVDITSTGAGFTIDDLEAGQYILSYPSGRLPAGYIFTYPVSVTPNDPRYLITVGEPPGPTCTPAGSPTGNQTVCTAGNQSRVDFGIALDPFEPWYQGVGGDMRSDAGLTNEIPPTLKFSETDSNNPSPGVIFGFNLVGSPSTQRTKASIRGWRITGESFAPNLIKTSYEYVSSAVQKSGTTPRNMIGGSSPACSGGASNCTLSPNISPGVYRANGSVTIGAPIDFPENGDFIFLIDDNLTINSAILVPNTSTAIFIVRGNITVGPNVNNLHGIYSANRNFIVQGNSSGGNAPLEIEGSVIANAGKSGSSFDASDRDLETRNADTAAVRIIFRPDFVLNAPDILKDSTYKIRELAPGQ